MDQCQRVRQILMDHFSKQDSYTEFIGNDPALSAREHLQRCSSCRDFQADLLKLGARLNSLETRLSSEIQVPSGAYFESLINQYSKATPSESNNKSPLKGAAHIQGQPQQKARDFKEVMAFLGTGVAILSGIGLLLQAGYIIPVAVVFGMISMLLPLMLLMNHKPQPTDPH